MPNHMRGIIALNVPVGAGFTPAQNINKQPVPNINQPPHPGQLQRVAQPHPGQPHGIAPTGVTIGDMVRTYKSLVANACLKIYKSRNETIGPLWQRNYYEHIIRNEPSHQTISQYVLDNPAKWQADKFYRS